MQLSCDDGDCATTLAGLEGARWGRISTIPQLTGDKLGVRRDATPILLSPSRRCFVATLFATTEAEGAGCYSSDYFLGVKCVL
jgi:hypothetical protein